MGYKSSSSAYSGDLMKMTDEMKISPQKPIWTSGRLATYSEGEFGSPPYYYFYGSRIEENGNTNSYGSWLVLHYNNGTIQERKNVENGVRPIIKLNYDIKLKKNIDSAGKIFWQILDE